MIRKRFPYHASSRLHWILQLSNPIRSLSKEWR
jgi:hypothetical protein